MLKRILFVAAGPFFNMLLAVIIFFGLFMIKGVIVITPSVGEVREGTPAHEAGIRKGDMIVGIGGREIETWDEMAEIISESKGRELAVSVRRGKDIRLFHIRPQITKTRNIFGEDIERYVIGITSSGEIFSRDVNLFEALFESIIRTYQITELTILSIIKIIQGTLSTKTLGGPIMIAEMAGQQVREGNLVLFIALLSVNLGDRKSVV